MDLDVTSLLEAALQQGIWAALYIYLFFRIQNVERECQQRRTISEYD